MKVIEQVNTVAEFSCPVLLVGETSVGKYRVARWIADKSKREPFVEIRCAELSPRLAASEPLGQVKGATTGATSVQLGWWQEADGGTLFLSELAELDLEVQSELQRALGEGRLRPVGSVSERSVNVRVIASLSEDPDKPLQEGRLLRDLLHRFDVRINVPPPSDWGDDLRLFAGALSPLEAAEHNKGRERFPERTQEALEARPFPGNERESETNVITAVIAADAGATEVKPLHLGQRSAVDSGGTDTSGGAISKSPPISKSARASLLRDELSGLSGLRAPTVDEVRTFIEARYVGKGQPRAWIRRWRAARGSTRTGRFQPHEASEVAEDIIKLMDVYEGRADWALIARLQDLGVIDDRGAKDLRGKLPLEASAPGGALSPHTVPPQSGALAKGAAPHELSRQISACILSLRDLQVTQGHPTLEQAIVLLEQWLRVLDQLRAAQKDEA